MQWILIIVALLTAVPTFGISIIILIIILPYLSAKTRRDIMPQLIRKALYSGGAYYEDNIYYEAAERYAQDSHNVDRSTSYSISFYELIDNQKVYVTFGKNVDGGEGVAIAANYA